jgi:translocation and assembly module TamA
MNRIDKMLYRNYKIFMMIYLFGSFLMADDLVLSTHKIHFTGQKYFTTSELEDALGVDNKSFFEFWKQDNPRIKDKLLPTLEESVKSFYASEGFYDAKISIDETNDTVIVKIKENLPVIIEKIEIDSDYNISTLLTLKEGDIFKAKSFIDIKNKIIAQLLTDGYCSYDLDTKAYVDLDKHSVDIKYHLKRGGICTFGKLSLSGLKTIDDDVVISRVRALEGKRFNKELVQDTSNNLYALGAFDSVLINVDRKFYNVIPVDIKLEEIEKPYHMEVGAGYDTYIGPRIHGEITKYNFIRDAQKLRLKASWSKKEQLLILNYFRPARFHIFGYYLDIGADIGYSNLEFEGFKEEKAFSKAYYQYEDEKLKLRFGIATEIILINKLDNLNEGEELHQAVNEGDFVLTYPYIDIVYDARDSKLNPKYGYYLAGYTEIGLADEDDSNVYMKTLLEARFIHTFSDLTLSVVGKVGVLDDESGRGLPESKYFFGGGSFSNRAYGFREIGVILSPTEDTINGASSMMNLSFEANYPVWGDVYAAVFTDNTMLTDQSYNFKGDIISSAGMGIRYMTPIGPFKIDVGFNVNDPSIYGIAFQIGQSF